mgnify:CR=1 FL=1
MPKFSFRNNSTLIFLGLRKSKFDVKSHELLFAQVKVLVIRILCFGELVFEFPFSNYTKMTLVSTV